MDTLDIKIFRELVQDTSGSPFVSDPRWTYRKLAKSLRVDEGTVRSRVRKLQETGFLQGWAVLPNPRLFGRGLAQVWLDFFPQSGKEDFIRKLQLIDGVAVVVNFGGNSIYFAMLYDDESSLKRRLELVQRLGNPEKLFCSRLQFPRCEGKLSASDLKILKQLHERPRASYDEIAKELGMSAKTVKRRLALMVGGRAIFVLPKMNPRALQGALGADLLVTYTDGEQKKRLDKEIAARFEERLVRVEISNEDASFFNLVVMNLAQAQEVLDWVKEKRGVASARIDLVQDRIEHYDRFWEKFEYGLTREPPIKV